MQKVSSSTSSTVCPAHVKMRRLVEVSEGHGGAPAVTQSNNVRAGLRRLVK